MAKSFSDPGDLVDDGPDGRWVVEGVGKLVLGVVMKDTLLGWLGVGESGVDQALVGGPVGVGTGPGTKAAFFVGRVGKSSLVVGFLVVVVMVVVVNSTLVVGFAVVVVVVVVDEVIGCIGAKGASAGEFPGGFVDG